MSSQEQALGMNALSKPQRMAIANACRRHHVARLHAFGSLFGPITDQAKVISTCWLSSNLSSQQT